MIVHWEYFWDGAWQFNRQVEVETFDQAVQILNVTKWSSNSRPQRLWVEFVPRIECVTTMVPK